jgi:hypothetical protein
MSKEAPGPSISWPTSAVGQSRHFDHAPTTSGLPDKQTFSASIGMSQRCQTRKCRLNLMTSSARSTSRSGTFIPSVLAVIVDPAKFCRLAEWQVNSLAASPAPSWPTEWCVVADR